MKKYKLTPQEKEIIENFQKTPIPSIFSSREFPGYIQYFEYVDFDVCEMLLKGKSIDKKFFDEIIMYEDPYFYVGNLKGYELDYYYNYLQVIEIAKKYYDC